MTYDEMIYYCEYFRDHPETNDADTIRLGTELFTSMIEAFKEIKKIKANPCADCVSRQYLVDKATCWDKHFADGIRYVALTDILNAPSVTPAPKMGRWIPVSDRLPEVGSEVLVCFDFKGNRSVYISDFYGDGEFHGLDDEYLTSEGRKYRKAVAWMPLPEPYKIEPQESEDNK